MLNCDDIQSVPRIIAERYRVRKTIIGGMGVVYLCEDSEQDNFPLALKTLKPEYLSDNKYRAQFLHEAAIWVEIGWHPNIRQAYRLEYLAPSQEIYLVLERIPMIPGESDPSLRSWIKHDNLITQEKTLNLLLDITRGMKFATSKVPGLIHRDLKPENIYIDLEGRARISDFGLVSAPVNVLEELTGKNRLSENSRLKLGGTPLYMSPEQWRNRRITVSSDIYALGCIGLEMLTGNYVVHGRHIRTIAEEHLRGGAMKRLDEANFKDNLKSFFAKCLQVDQRKRFQSWETVEGELVALHKRLYHQKIQDDDILMDVSWKSQVDQGETILSIGKAYLDIDEIWTAIKYFERGRNIGRNQDHQELVANAEANLGTAYCKLYQYELAIYHFQKAIAQYWECGEIKKAFLNYGNISNAYFQLGDLNKAQDNITKVMEYSVQINDKKVMDFWNANLANMIMNCGDTKSALEFLLYTLKVEEKRGSDRISMKFMEILDQFMCGAEENIS